MRALTGVRLTRPVRRANRSELLPRDSAALAIDLTEKRMRIHLVAIRLPLPPLLDPTETVAQRAVIGSRWPTAGL